MRKWLLVAIVGALALSANLAGATQGPNRRNPPRVALVHKREVVQRARPWTYCWGYTTGKWGISECADGMPRFPKAVVVDAPTKLTIRIPYPVKPRDWEIGAYRQIERHEGWDETIGPAEELDYKMRPYRVQGDIKGWNATFTVTEDLRHFYLETGGDLRQGDVIYSLHART